MVIRLCSTTRNRLWRCPKISVPTIALAGDSNPLYPLSSMAERPALFTGHYERRVLQGIGHNVPKEHPAAFIQAVKDVLDRTDPH
jgi:pimeloyl-ACP methyl ester carboxylesterase